MSRCHPSRIFDFMHLKKSPPFYTLPFHTRRMKLALLLPLSIATMVVAKDGVGPFLHGKTHKHPKALKETVEMSSGTTSPTPSMTTFEPSSLLVVGGGSSSPSVNNHPTESPVIITNAPTQSDSVDSDSEGNDELVVIGGDTSNEDSTSSSTINSSSATISTVQSSTSMSATTSYTASTTSSASALPKW